MIDKKLAAGELEKIRKGYHFNSLPSDLPYDVKIINRLLAHIKTLEKRESGLNDLINSNVVKYEKIIIDLQTQVDAQGKVIEEMVLKPRPLASPRMCNGCDATMTANGASGEPCL